MDSKEGNSAFKNRLAKVIGDQDPYPWAESLGIGKSTFSGPWTKGAMPQTKTLLKIAENTDISLNWLLTGRGSERIGGRAAAEAEQAPVPYKANQANHTAGTSVEDLGERYQLPADEYVLVPRYGVQVNDGQRLQSDQVVDFLSFKLDWVEGTMGLDSRQLALINVCGDSMEPTLREGDFLLLDRRGFSVPGRVHNDAIYVLLRGQDVVVKRLQCSFNGCVTIQSDNPAYAVEVLSEEKSAQLQVIGRVVWVGRKL